MYIYVSTFINFLKAPLKNISVFIYMCSECKWKTTAYDRVREGVKEDLQRMCKGQQPFFILLFSPEVTTSHVHKIIFLWLWLCVCLGEILIFIFILIYQLVSEELWFSFSSFIIFFLI